MIVYVAGPYTKGDVAVNVKNAIDLANDLLNAGHAPFVPHLFHFQHMAHPQEYRTWLTYDFIWLAQCEALIRLPGESSGADEEIEFCDQNDIPVYYSLEGFLATNPEKSF